MKNSAVFAKSWGLGMGTLMVLLSAGSAQARVEASSEDAVFATRETSRSLAQRGDLRGALAECKKLPVPYAPLCNAEVHVKNRRAAQADEELALVKLPESASTRIRAWQKLVEGKTRGLALETEQAGLLFREASTLSPGSCEPFAAKGDIATGEVAVTAYRRAAELCPSDRDIASSLAHALPAGEERLAVLRKLREKQGEKSFDAETLSLLAESAAMTGAVDEAEGAAKICLTLRPGDRAATLVAAEGALRTKNATEAEALARGLVKRNPSDRLATVILAKSLAAQDKLDPAADAFRTAFAIDTHDATPLVLAARMWLDHGRLTTARGYATKATEEVPTSKEAWATLGAVHQAEHHPEAASQAFARAK